MENTRKVNISQASTPLEQRRRALSAAQQHYANADYSAAIRILQQHLEQSPAAQIGSRSESAEITTVDARIYRQLALAQLRLNQTDAAINTLEHGHLRAPEDIELHMLYARMLLEQDGSERAYTMLRQMPQPQITKHPDFYALRAALARQQEAYIEAVELYSLLCQIHPERGDWRLGLAISQHQQGDLDQAHQNYQRAANNTRLDQKLRDFAARKAGQMQTSNPGSS
jgi:predicted Zn-dependent protease